MDNSHVALVSLVLNAAAFETFRCDRNMCVSARPLFFFFRARLLMIGFVCAAAAFVVKVFGNEFGFATEDHQMCC